MKMSQHIKVGKITLDRIGKDNIKKYRINKLLFILGNIAPDINCVYPAHRLCDTENRFYKKLKYVFNTDGRFIKSFELGTINHYICDYFCYPHNIKSLGLPHRKYENNLYKFFKLHFNEISNKEIDISNFSIELNNKCDAIIKQIKETIEQYSKLFTDNEKNIWTCDVRQIIIDLSYATCMSERVLKFILDT